MPTLRSPGVGLPETPLIVLLTIRLVPEIAVATKMPQAESELPVLRTEPMTLFETVAFVTSLPVNPVVVIAIPPNAIPKTSGELAKIISEILFPEILILSSKPTKTPPLAVLSHSMKKAPCINSATTGTSTHSSLSPHEPSASVPQKHGTDSNHPPRQGRSSTHTSSLSPTPPAGRNMSPRQPKRSDPHWTRRWTTSYATPTPATTLNSAPTGPLDPAPLPPDYTYQRYPPPHPSTALHNSSFFPRRANHPSRWR